MGEQIQAIREMLEKDEELQICVRKAIIEIIIDKDRDILEMLEDPQNNERVQEVLQEVGRAIFDTEDQRLIRHFRILCQMTGVPIEWDKSNNDVVIDLGPISDDFEPAEKPSAVTVPIARMTGEHQVGKPGGRKEVKVLETRMKYIKEGSITMEILPEEGQLPSVAKGDVVNLTRGMDRVNVRITRVYTYKDIYRLMDDLDLTLKKWLPGMGLSDIQTVATRMFSGSQFEGHRLIAFEFEKQ